MRFLRHIGLALFGLVLAFPMAAWADDTCPSCKAEKKHRHGFRSMRVCENCMRAQRAANGGAAVPPPVMLAGGCATCQAQAMAAGMPTGYASTANGMMASEPAPIGVVQASYKPAAAASAPGHAVVGPPSPAAPETWASPNFVAPSRHDHPRVIANLLGLPRLGGIHEYYADRRREAHAAIAFGRNGQPISELPASMVYRP